MTGLASRALEQVVWLADTLCDSALECDGRATWLGWRASSQGPGSAYGTLDGTVYDGTAGVAMFLAELATVTDNETYRRIATSAARHAVHSRPEDFGADSIRGYYAGLGGALYIAACVGMRLDVPDLIEDARRQLQVLERLPAPKLLDVISGNAGMLQPLAELSRDLAWSDATRTIAKWAQQVLAASRERPVGRSWPKVTNGCEAIEDLTGLAHGASGFALGLDAAADHLEDQHLRSSAAEARSWEDTTFDEAVSNWPDFRLSESEADLVTAYELAFGGPVAVRSEAREGRFSTAWCHGAPGIGLARIACGDEDAVRRALRSTKRAVRSGASPGADFSLCHGIAGCCEFLLEGGRLIGDGEAVRLALDAAAWGLDEYGRRIDAWPCDPAVGRSPALMTGLTGIGHFYLRVARPEAGQTALLPGGHLLAA